MSELSVFIDESGDVGSNSEFYIVTLLFHDQASSVDPQIEALDQQLRYCGFPTDCAIHSGPIIRREDMYANMDIAGRKRIFAKMCAFTRKSGISYASFCYRKKEFDGRLKLKTRLARDLSLFIDENIRYFTSFDRVIVYYDNGQSIVTETISTVLAVKFFDIDIRKVLPSDYRLFQAADLLCTLELLGLKANAHCLSASELKFFGSERKLRKDYLKKLGELRFGK